MDSLPLLGEPGPWEDAICYLLGISLEKHTLVRALQTLERTPPDILEGITTSSSCLGGNRNEIQFLLDCLGFTADYPAVSYHQPIVIPVQSLST